MSSSKASNSVHLTHLNDDTSWLIRLPRPDTSTTFNILVDPWLAGPQTDFFTAFSTYWHSEPSAFQTIDAIKERIDAVLVSHEYTDHMHRATLLQVSQLVPVYAPQKAARIIRSWSHFHAVHEVQYMAAGACWRTSILPGLPPTVALARIRSVACGLIPHFHSAICIVFQTAVVTDEAAAILYCPHGTSANGLNLLRNHGITKVRALLHGLDSYWNPMILGGQLNLGAPNGLQVARATNAQYWIATHDERKKGFGLVHMVLGHKAWTVEAAVALERGNATPPQFIRVGNGEELALHADAEPE